MTKDQQDQHLHNFVQKMRQTLNKKGNDYANDKDRLSGFKSAAKLARTTSQDIILNQIAIKAERLFSLLKENKEPKNEPVADTILDMVNYLVLLDSTLQPVECKHWKQPEPKVYPFPAEPVDRKEIYK